MTLIELLVVLAIIAILLMAGLPYTRGWVESNRQMQARNMMWEAVAQTRAIALRNPGTTSIDDTTAAAASLKVDAALHTVSVYAADPATALWTATLPKDATINLADAANTKGAAVACIGFDNRGQRLATAADCVTAASATRIAISLGSEDPLYVDLL